MAKIKEKAKGESRLAPFDRTRADELLMSDDAYIRRFGMDSELRELRTKIAERRFPAVSKMKTLEEVRAHLAECEAMANAETKAAYAPGARFEDHALAMEMRWSWVGALNWVLGEDADTRGRTWPRRMNDEN